MKQTLQGIIMPNKQKTVRKVIPRTKRLSLQEFEVGDVVDIIKIYPKKEEIEA